MEAGGVSTAAKVGSQERELPGFFASIVRYLFKSTSKPSGKMLNATNLRRFCPLALRKTGPTQGLLLSSALFQHFARFAF